MDLRPITKKQKSQYNKLVNHVMQSWEWGEFRKSLGTPVLRYGIYKNGKLSQTFQLTLHKIPIIGSFVGFLPKGSFPNKELAAALKQVAKKNNCSFIKVEPNVIASEASQSRLNQDSDGTNVPRNDIVDHHFKTSPKPLFTIFNFIIDLTKSEEEILKNMHSKTRYNIRVAQKNGVKIEERTDDNAFNIYQKLYFETTKRQGYYGHNENYQRQIWQNLKKTGVARLLIGFYQNQPLTAWMLFKFKDTLYYPYGGSSKDHPEVMSNNLVAWEAIKLGKKLKLKKFDMWGAANTPNPNPSDPYYGFHRFKKGYGGEFVQYIGTFDLVLNWPVYFIFTFVDKLMPLKILLLKLLKH